MTPKTLALANGIDAHLKKLRNLTRDLPREGGHPPENMELYAYGRLMQELPPHRRVAVRAFLLSAYTDELRETEAAFDAL